jgi:hypothetical protein
MPIATSSTSTSTKSEINTKLAGMEWLAAKDVSAEVGGQANVESLKRVSYDLSSMYPFPSIANVNDVVDMD